MMSPVVVGDLVSQRGHFKRKPNRDRSAHLNAGQFRKCLFPYSDTSMTDSNEALELLNRLLEEERIDDDEFAVLGAWGDGRFQCNFVTADGEECQRPNAREAGYDTGLVLCHQHFQELSTASFLEASDHLKQDVREFWQRNAFFILVEGGLLTVYGAVFASADAEFVTANANFRTALIAFGFLTALVWLWVLIWSVVWISRWLQVVERIEESLPFLRLHRLAGQGIQTGSAVQSVTVVLPLAAIIGWFLVLPAESEGGWPVAVWGLLFLGVQAAAFLVILPGAKAVFDRELRNSVWGRLKPSGTETQDPLG